MNNSNSYYIQELNKLWHRSLNLTQYRKMEQKFGELNELSTVQIGIISMIYHKPDVIFREICEEFNLPKSTLTNIIDKLEKIGYVKRIISSRDRRSYGLQLTEEGKAIQKQHFEFENEMLNSVLNALDTDEEKQMLISLIDKIIKKFENIMDN